MVREFKLNESLLRRLESHYKRRLTCHYCGKPLREGESVVSKASRKIKHYHLKCFKQLYR